MSIRIHNDGLAGTNLSQTDRTQATSIGSGDAAQAGQFLSNSGSDQISISPLSEKIADAGRAADTQQQARVHQLTALYQSGQYQVDSLRLSRSLISSSLESGNVKVTQ